MADPVETRLRAARPAAADVDPDAFDALLLERVKSAGPEAPGRAPRRRSAVAVAVAVAAATVAAVLLTVPGARTPTADAAIRQARTWFSPPAGTVLHIRSELRSPHGSTLVQETWQSVDDPARQRRVESQDGLAAESDSRSEDVYDAATNTIYAHVAPDTASVRAGFERKLEGMAAEGAPEKQLDQVRRDMRAYLRGDVPDAPAGEPLLGDATVVEVRRLLRRGEAELGDEAVHAGVPARPITLRVGPPGDGRPRWTLWTAADDGRPLELRIDHGPGTRVEEATRWTTYEVVPEDPALLSIRAAHPGARVVRDRAAYDAAIARLYPNG